MAQRNILILHSSKAILNLLNRLILAELDDARTHLCNNAQEVEVVIDRDVFDVILCDLNLEDTVDSGLLKRIRQSAPNTKTPIVIIKSPIDGQADNVSVSDESAHYLISPFTATDLREMISRISNPRDKRKQERYCIPGTKAIIHFQDSDVVADMINMSLGSVYCEFDVTLDSISLLKSINLSIQFPEEYDWEFIRNAECRVLTIRAMKWDSDDTVLKIRIVLIIKNLAKRNVAAYSRVLDKVAENNRKLAGLG